jgi:hypothetical protein
MENKTLQAAKTVPAKKTAAKSAKGTRKKPAAKKSSLDVLHLFIETYAKL